MKVFFLDIDDCLIETSRLGKNELTALETSLIKLKVPNSSEITKEFANSFHCLYDRHQGKKLTKSDLIKLKQYMSRLKELETNIIHKFGQIKKWSREVCLYISAEKYKAKLTNRKLITASNKPWQAITNNTPFYPDAKRFLQSLIIKHQPFYLITSSDCRLQYDDKKDEFIYDPDYSRKLKLKRLEKFIKNGVPVENILIGDPSDKPSLQVFKNALQKAKKDLEQPFESIMIGDSLKNDLIPAQKAGINQLILINRNKIQINKDINEDFEEVKNFDQLTF